MKKIVLFLLLTSSMSFYGQLVVNEIMAQNTSTVTDPNGQYEDWFELYNNSTTPISLNGLFATDDPANLLKWQFPDGLTIPGGGYLSIWADNDLADEGLHAGFKFSAAGESCILSYANGTIIQNITFGQQQADMGYARVPNGTGNFVIQAPTYNANNNLLGVNEAADFSLHLQTYPNPTSGILNIINDSYTIETVKIYNLKGQLLEQIEIGLNQATIDLSSYAAGVYVVNINDMKNIRVIKK